MFGDTWLHLTALLLLIGALSDHAAITVLGILIFFTDGLTRLWSFFSFRGVSYEHRFSVGRAFHDEVINVELEVSNRKALPLLWVEVNDLVPEELPLSGADLTPSPTPKMLVLSRTTSVASHDRMKWSYELTCAKRGYYRLGPASIRSGDLFGVFPRRQEVGHSRPLLVYPKMVPLPELAFPQRRPFGDVRSNQRIFEDPSRIIGVRDYHPTDPLNRVDWKATARSQSLQVKQFEPSTTLHLLILLNIDTLGHSWEGYIPELLERAVSGAASVARYAFEHRWAVGLMANGTFPYSEYPIRIPSNRNPNQLIHILEALAGTMPLTTSTLVELIEEESHRFPWGATIACVAAKVTEELWGELARLKQRGHPVTLLNVSGRPIESPIPGIDVVELPEPPAFSGMK